METPTAVWGGCVDDCHVVQLQGVEIDASKCSASCSADDAWLGVRGRPGVLKGNIMKF